jgi:2-polyprenyl-3-methyl-5-hydroxy-6-metoxy-1,4-benzoquinol methylase
MEHKKIQKKHFDAIAAQYTSRIDEKSYKHYFEFTRANIVNALKEGLKNLPECKGLDVGCGQGDLAAAIFITEAFDN